MHEHTRAQEYDTLRQELLLLFQRAHDVWRWMLLALMALLGAEFVALTTVYGQHRAPTEINDLATLLAGQSELAAIVLCVLAGGIALLLWQLHTDVVIEMHRIGGYVAVFHDDGTQLRADVRDVGWHIWNRIDKIQNNPFDVRKQPDAEKRMFHGRWIVGVCLLLLIVICNIGVFVSLAGARCSYVAIGGAVIVGVVGRWTWIMDKRGRQSLMMWNRRWADLATAKADLIQAYVVNTGVRL